MFMKFLVKLFFYDDGNDSFFKNASFSCSCMKLDAGKGPNIQWVAHRIFPGILEIDEENL